MKASIWVVLIASLIGCGGNNNTVFEKYHEEFSDSIAKNNAKKYDYQFDGLVPQSSFFVGTKLKYLKYSHGPENGSIESLVFFDLKTDSIIKIVRRRVYYGWNNETNERTDDFTDSLIVISTNPQRTLTFAGNKQIDSTFDLDELQWIRNLLKA